MNKELEIAVENFVSRIKGTGSKGKMISKSQFLKTNKKLGGILPDWYIELFTNFPISGADIYYPIYELSGDGNEEFSMTIALKDRIYEETELYYPGTCIKSLGYFCFATELTGCGDQGFTTSKQGDNPPVFLVYHDVSDIGEEIVKHGMIKIAESLSDFFNKAKPVVN